MSAQQLQAAQPLLPQTPAEAIRAIKKLCKKSESDFDVDFKGICSIFTRFKSLRLSKFTSPNLILHAVSKEENEAFNFFVNYFCGRDGLISQGVEKRETFLEYLNATDKYKFSALSYAAYFKLEDIALRLIELGADFQHINNDEDTIMILAAKGDSLKVIMKLQELGEDIYQKKNGNLSLLHFACFEGNLNIVKYLLKMNELDGGDRINLNEPDNCSGETPLHMAVGSGEYPVVKYLLINGASTTLRSFDTHTAYEKALDLKIDPESSAEFVHRINGIIGLLGEIPLRKRFQLQTRVGPVKRFNAYSFMTILLNVLGFVGCFFVIPYTDKTSIIGPIFLFLELLTITLLWLTRSNPGYITPFGHQSFTDGASSETAESARTQSTSTKSNEITPRTVSRSTSAHVAAMNFATSKKEIYLQNFSNLMRCKQYENLCIECCIVKPLRSKHCDFCRKCIAVMDHHCPFVGNCIGSKNHKYFFFMLVTQFLTQMFILLICVLFYVKGEGDDFVDDFSHYLITKFSSIFLLDIAIVATAILLAAFLLTVFPLYFMLKHQLTAVIHGMTSIELRFKFKNAATVAAATAPDSVDAIPSTERAKSTLNFEKSLLRSASIGIVRNRTQTTGLPTVVTISNNNNNNAGNAVGANVPSIARTNSIEKSNIMMEGEKQKETVLNDPNRGSVELKNIDSKKQFSKQSMNDPSRQSQENSKWQNVVNLLFRNANNPMYFASESLHRTIFTGQDPSFASTLSMTNSQYSSDSALDSSLITSKLVIQ